MIDIQECYSLWKMPVPYAKATDTSTRNSVYSSAAPATTKCEVRRLAQSLLLNS